MQSLFIILLRFQNMSRLLSHNHALKFDTDQFDLKILFDPSRTINMSDFSTQCLGAISQQKQIEDNQDDKAPN